MKRLTEIGYCGLDCKKCDAYIATIRDDQALREKTAKLWAELNNAPILPEHINCEGCRADGAKTVFCEHMCEIRKCALGKGVATSRALGKIGEVGGPRCCKRDSYLAIIEAARFTKEQLGISMETENIVCSRSSMNSQCIKSRCPFYGGGTQ